MIETIELTNQAALEQVRGPFISASATSPEGVVLSASLDRPRYQYSGAKVLTYDIKIAVRSSMSESFIERCHELLLENYPDADLDNAILPMFMEGGLRVISASSTKSPKVYGDISVGSRAWMVGRLFPFKTKSDRVGLNFRLIYVSAV